MDKNWHFLQCDDCGLRFPGEVDIACPVCKASTKATIAAASHEDMDGRATQTVLGVIDNLRSVHNIGSIFRSADCLGIKELVIGGISATPDHPKLARAALGAQDFVSWRYVKNTLLEVEALKAAGYTIVALEATSTSIPLDEVPPANKYAVVVGNEVVGVDPHILQQADYIAAIPMTGNKRSMNAAVAFGVASYALAKPRT